MEVQGDEALICIGGSRARGPGGQQPECIPCWKTLSGEGGELLAAHNVLSMARKLSAFPTIEVCKDDQTHYMVPLSRQTDFFVPEMRDEVKTELREDESDEDRGTDITGADSHSDVSSVSGGVPWDSREMPLVASLASALPLRDLADGEEHPGPRLSDRDSDKSVGSGSSFEELDMEQVECPEEEEEEEEDEIKEKEAEVGGGGEGGGAAARGGVEKQEKEDGVGSKGAVESMAEEERREPSGDGEE
ncbi:Testis-expressed protein 264 [Merluccius polli]|uniref:Testis-expressed protein 264 n=1 Tax=Merluccius polli TaxID=89951 RepID=A0AA47N5J9_MERPO|nr:Testis-expressed protein 264 [Merluccius polli]